MLQTWLERTAVIAQIQNPELKKSKADDLINEIEQLSHDIQFDPAAARALEQTITASLVQGLKGN